MAYKVVITPPAKRQLEKYIEYTLIVLKNKQGARAIRDDTKRTKERLAQTADCLALCEDIVLSKNGYRKILFDKHDFLWYTELKIIVQ